MNILVPQTYTNIAMEGSEETSLLDPKMSPLLLFHYNYCTPVEESDDDKNFSDQDEPEEEDEQDDNVSHEEDSDDGENFSDQDEPEEEEEEDDNASHEEESDGDENFSEQDKPEEEEEAGDNSRHEEHDLEKSDSDDALAEEEEEAEKTYRDDDSGDLFLYSISTGKLQGIRSDDLESHFYWVTPQGWLLMRHRGSHQTFLWNPFTRQRVTLPSSDGEFLEEKTTRCLLSHAPTDPNCVVLVVNYMDTVFWYCSPATGTQWSEHRYDSRRLHESRNNAVRRMRHLAASGGMFYTDMAYALVALRFSPHPTFTVTPFSNSVKSQNLYSCIGFTLLESCGELFKLSLGQQFYVDKILHIRVEKLNIAERAWVKVKTLGDRVFLVNSKYFGASLSAEEVGLKRNCIYFLKCCDKGLYVHNMERGTTALHNPGEDLQDDVTAEILLIPTS